MQQSTVIVQNQNNTLAPMDVGVLPNDVSAESFASMLAIKRSEQANDDPFYTMDMGQILRQHQQWCREMPRITPHYAVKCNNDPNICQVLANLGTGFDCASKGEIEQITAMGVSPSRIIYANPCKTSSHIRYAAAKGVDMMTFDAESELHKIKRLHPAARMVLRIGVHDTTAVCPLNMKFGCDPVAVAPELLRAAAELGIAVVGISFHVGSGCRDPTAYGEAITHARRLFDLGAALGHDVTILDVGGGFPGSPSEDITFEEAARVINHHLSVHFAADAPENADLRVIAEPGRFYAHAAYTLCVNVIAVKDVPARELAEQDVSALEDINEMAKMYYVNDGVYGSFNCTLYDHYTPPFYAVGKCSNAPLTWCNVWGPTCDSFDCILPRTRLPRLDCGDWLCFPKMGAYTVAAYSDFNGFEKPDIHYMVNAAVWPILSNILSCPVESPEIARLLVDKVRSVEEMTTTGDDITDSSDDGDVMITEDVRPVLGVDLMSGLFAAKLRCAEGIDMAADDGASVASESTASGDGSSGGLALSMTSEDDLVAAETGIAGPRGPMVFDPS